MTTIEITSTSKTIKHICGHETTVEVDRTTKAWVKFHAGQPCYVCQPTEQVERLCGHVEQIERGFHSPRAAETAAMQLCQGCR